MLLRRRLSGSLTRTDLRGQEVRQCPCTLIVSDGRLLACRSGTCSVCVGRLTRHPSVIRKSNSAKVTPQK